MSVHIHTYSKTLIPGKKWGVIVPRFLTRNFWSQKYQLNWNYFSTKKKINFWKVIQRINPVWHFDATGVILKPIQSQGPVYLYNIVCHDPVQKNIIPLAQFFTTQHSTHSISRYLLSIKNNFLKSCANKSDSFALAPIIVTDESWASINAISDIFNNCGKLNSL